MTSYNVKLFRKEEGVVRKISETYSVLNLLTAKDSDKVSVAVGTATDHVETTKTLSDRAYYIIDGEMIVNDEIRGGKGDVVFVPANTKYHFSGTFKAVLINSPPFKNNK